MAAAIMKGRLQLTVLRQNFPSSLFSYLVIFLFKNKPSKTLCFMKLPVCFMKHPVCSMKHPVCFMKYPVLWPDRTRD